MCACTSAALRFQGASYSAARNRGPDRGRSPLKRAGPVRDAARASCDSLSSRRRRRTRRPPRRGSPPPPAAASGLPVEVPGRLVDDELEGPPRVRDSRRLAGTLGLQRQVHRRADEPGHQLLMSFTVIMSAGWAGVLFKLMILSTF